MNLVFEAACPAYIAFPVVGRSNLLSVMLSRALEYLNLPTFGPVAVVKEVEDFEFLVRGAFLCLRVLCLSSNRLTFDSFKSWHTFSYLIVDSWPSLGSISYLRLLELVVDAMVGFFVIFLLSVFTLAKSMKAPGTSSVSCAFVLRTMLRLDGKSSSGSTGSSY